MGLEEIKALDLVTFARLGESCQRILGAEKSEQAYTLMIASQGDSKSLKKWVKRWDPDPQVRKKALEDTGKGSAESFIKKYPRGL